MNSPLEFSVIVPVYNRPNEVEELLQSLEAQTDSNFEVVIVEDGSNITCEDICKKYSNSLNIKYFYKQNSGPGGSRNFGVERCSGNYVIIFDSDIIVPNNYIKIVRECLTASYCDAFGGPDSAHSSFSDMQKAVNYAMTSLFTTGGIRGGGMQMEVFHPRSFNMGISKEVFMSLNGFSAMRYGEDIDFSIRIIEGAHKVSLIKEAFVYHKRRTNLEDFFRQVNHSGQARIALWQKYKNYKGSLKIVHFLPALFTIFSALLLLLSILSFKFLYPLFLFCIIVFVDSLAKNKTVKISALSVVASFTQLFGYGSGFLYAAYNLLKKRIKVSV